jgi:hypothetical protein
MHDGVVELDCHGEPGPGIYSISRVHFRVTGRTACTRH